MINPTKIEILILSLLYKTTKDVYIFTLFNRCKIGFNDFFNAIHNLESNKLVEIIEDKISLTHIGIKYTSTRSASYRKEKQWRKIPETFKIAQIDKDEKYIPNIFLMDKKILN
jgi:hypothetical protein